MKMATRFIFKIAAVLLIIGLNYSGFFAVGQALAAFFDNEASVGSFSAASLDFSLTDSGWNPIESEVNLELGNTAFKDVRMTNDGILNFQYTAETANESGDIAFCNSLDLTAKLLGEEMYNGSLTGFLSTATGTINTWNYRIDMPANFQNSVCGFDFLYNGWQTDMPLYGSGGFFDTEKVENTISSWGLRINKVYYDVAPDRGVEGDNEWVEIYNQTNVPLDISGWQICDNTSCDIIPAASPILGEGFAVISVTGTTWGYWDIPPEVVKIVLADGKIGNGLSNDADELTLKRPDGVVIDQMSWGPGGSPDVPEGNMLGRNPNGYDTNQASDFVEFGPPNLNLIYPDQSGALTWYWAYRYDIQWTASNPNGPDSELLIDLYYIKDVNHDSIISAGDTLHRIARNTQNDGLFGWTVPSGFLGYIWVKVVAKGPENPMLTDSMISGKIYDPFSSEMWNTNPNGVLEALAEDQDEGGEIIGDEGIEISLGDGNFIGVQPENSVPDIPTPQENIILPISENPDSAVAPTVEESSGEQMSGESAQGDSEISLTEESAPQELIITEEDITATTGDLPENNVLPEGEPEDVPTEEISAPEEQSIIIEEPITIEPPVSPPVDPPAPTE